MRILKKTLALPALLSWLAAFAVAGGTEQAKAARPGPPAAPPAKNLAVLDDLVKLLPRSMAGVVVLDAKALERGDGGLGPLWEAETQNDTFEFLKLIGVDPGKDVSSVVLGLVLMPAGEVDILTLRYDKGKVGRAIRNKVPGSRSETYNGVTVLSRLNEERKELPAEVALLDPSHIVLSSDVGVKGVIDVFLKKAEPLALNAEIMTLLKEVDTSGFAWGAVSIPPGLIKKGLGPDPLLKAFETVHGVTVTLGGDVPGSLVADIGLFGGTKEQNAGLASVLTGLKAIGTLASAQEPVLGELLSAVAITSGEDYTRLNLTASHETLGKIFKLRKRSGLTIPMWPRSSTRTRSFITTKADMRKPSRSIDGPWPSGRRCSGRTIPMWPRS